MVMIIAYALELLTAINTYFSERQAEILRSFSLR
jgi:hypothetical protein